MVQSSIFQHRFGCFDKGLYIQMTGIGPRLREERERLELTQREFGQVGGWNPMPRASTKMVKDPQSRLLGGCFDDRRRRSVCRAGAPDTPRRAGTQRRRGKSLRDISDTSYVWASSSEQSGQQHGRDGGELFGTRQGPEK